MPWPLTVTIARPDGSELFRVHRATDALGRVRRVVSPRRQRTGRDVHAPRHQPRGRPRGGVARSRWSTGPTSRGSRPSPVPSATSTPTRSARSWPASPSCRSPWRATDTVSRPRPWPPRCERGASRCRSPTSARSSAAILTRASSTPISRSIRPSGPERRPPGMKVDRSVKLQIEDDGRIRAIAPDGTDLGESWRDTPNLMATVAGKGFIDYHAADAEEMYEPGCKIHIDGAKKWTVVLGEKTEVKATPEARAAVVAALDTPGLLLGRLQPDPPAPRGLCLRPPPDPPGRQHHRRRARRRAPGQRTAPSGRRCPVSRARQGAPQLRVEPVRPGEECDPDRRVRRRGRPCRRRGPLVIGHQSLEADAANGPRSTLRRPAGILLPAMRSWPYQPDAPDECIFGFEPEAPASAWFSDSSPKRQRVHGFRIRARSASECMFSDSSPKRQRVHGSSPPECTRWRVGLWNSSPKRQRVHFRIRAQSASECMDRPHRNALAGASGSEVGFEPEAPASAWIAPTGMHSLARRARRSIAAAPTNLVPRAKLYGGMDFPASLVYPIAIRSFN